MQAMGAAPVNVMCETVQGDMDLLAGPGGYGPVSWSRGTWTC